MNVIYGYLEGLNAYAKKYPDEVLIKKSFPLSIYDYLTGLNLMLHLFSDTGDVIGQLFNNRIEPLDEMSGVDNIGNTIGSNGFAFKSSKTKDGKTYIELNPKGKMSVAQVIAINVQWRSHALHVRN